MYMNSLSCSGACLVCNSNDISELLDCGPQPIGNRFLYKPTDHELLHPLVIGQCVACGLIQLTSQITAAELAPKFEWITYREPEKHLDALADMIRELPGIDATSTVLGVSFKDDSLLDRLIRLEAGSGYRVDSSRFLGTLTSEAGVETVQDRLTEASADSVVESQGRANVVIARHILEHAHRPLEFMAALKKLVKPNGYLVIEIPDCSQELENLDYTSPWEEHTLYFTPETFHNFFSYAGFDFSPTHPTVINFSPAIAAILKPTPQVLKRIPSPVALAEEIHRANIYATCLEEYKEKTQTYFKEFRRAHGKIALFGAGHLACTYVYVLGLEEYISFVVDDHPQKVGMFMPGSKLPIYGSDALLRDDIQLCLLSLSPENEEKVMRANRDFVAKGGAFASIFPQSTRTLQV